VTLNIFPSAERIMEISEWSLLLVVSLIILQSRFVGCSGKNFCEELVKSLAELPGSAISLKFSC